MDFSQSTVFVLATSNTLPTTGGPQDFTAGQFGVLKPDYSPATAGNVAAQSYIYLAAGRNVSLPGVGSKRTSKIYANKVLNWYKVTAHPSVTQQIIHVTAITAQCGEILTLSLRLDSFYLRTSFFNGLTRSFTVKAPCCDCGADPCTDMDDAALVDLFVAAINADTLISPFIVASKTGTTGSAVLVLTGQALTAESAKVDPTVNNFQFDTLNFAAFIYTGPETTQDYNVWNACDPAGVVATTQDASYAIGTSAQMKLTEQTHMSYQMPPIAKELYSNTNFNNAFTSEVVAGTNYDFYYLRYETAEKHPMQDVVPMVYDVYIMNPTGQNAGTIAVLTAFFGTAVDESI